MSALKHFIDFPLFPAPEYAVFDDRRKGQNKRGVLIVLQSGEDTEVLQTFLSKILDAAKINLAQDALLLRLAEDESVHLPTLIRKDYIRTITAFGLQPARLGVRFHTATYQITKLGSTRFLFAHSLQEIYDERQKGGRQKAGALWKALQNLFPDESP